MVTNEVNEFSTFHNFLINYVHISSSRAQVNSYYCPTAHVIKNVMYENTLKFYSARILIVVIF